MLKVIQFMHSIIWLDLIVNCHLPIQVLAYVHTRSTHGYELCSPRPSTLSLSGLCAAAAAVTSTSTVTGVTRIAAVSAASPQDRRTSHRRRVSPSCGHWTLSAASPVTGGPCRRCNPARCLQSDSVTAVAASRVRHPAAAGHQFSPRAPPPSVAPLHCSLSQPCAGRRAAPRTRDGRLCSVCGSPGQPVGALPTAARPLPLRRHESHGERAQLSAECLSLFGNNRD